MLSPISSKQLIMSLDGVKLPDNWFFSFAYVQNFPNMLFVVMDIKVKLLNSVYKPCI